ncbi:unnamed protein product (mitochondrion) [Plasmodiophora brassicae]|uniref:Uncharacterized protein n=1 Tax=Plasmodiophora brassicae TaxID=37360 RepID=A0A0G4IMQ3_PLABS|nr:hypothetical protein PBRA_005100 [Plasmodiophora brassicae]SPQ99369.1 unnamed protein product [Plasmodiophora brassicae]
MTRGQRRSFVQSTCPMCTCVWSSSTLRWGLVYLYDSLCDPTYTARLRSIATNVIMPWATSAFPGKPFETRVLAEPRQSDG